MNRIAELAKMWFTDEVPHNEEEAEELLQSIFIIACGDDVEAAKVLLGADEETSQEFKKHTFNMPPYAFVVTIWRDIFNPYWYYAPLWYGRIESDYVKMDFEVILLEGNPLVDVYNILPASHATNLSYMEELAEIAFTRAFKQLKGEVDE